MRAAAATKASLTISKTRAIIEPLRLRGVVVPTTESQLVNELAERIARILPTKEDEASDDEDYF